MVALAAAGLLLNLAVGLVLGLRLLHLARRTRRLAETAIGTASVSVSIGALALAGSQRVAGEAANPLIAPWVAGWLLVGVGSVALSISVWRMFRPKLSWGFAIAGVVALTQLSGVAETAVAGVAPGPGEMRPLQLLGVAGRISVYSWAAFECFRYFGLLRRRMRLGLADPLIAHQILLWGISATLMAALLGVLNYGTLVLGVQGLVSPEILAITTPLGLAAAASIWFAFYPPAFYRRLVESRAAHGEV